MKPLHIVLPKINLETLSEPLTPKEREQRKADGYNAVEGTRHQEDGYDCRICKNKGHIMQIREYATGWEQVLVECKCVDVRNNILRMRKSGLKDIIKDYTFDKFQATEPWQQAIKAAAMEYAKHPEGWFFLGGQSGAGKTHLCTAICREFLLTGKRVQYMLWRDDIVRIKNAATDHEALAPMLDRLKNVDVLYIDDLFKTGKAPDGRVQKPSSADINYAFEVINYRYCNPHLLTIISSEWSEAELLEIDEAIAGRIYEKAKTYTIAKDRSRNYRIRNAVTL